MLGSDRFGRDSLSLTLGWTKLMLVLLLSSTPRYCSYLVVSIKTHVLRVLCVGDGTFSGYV